jgi:hypothetical protein
MLPPMIDRAVEVLLADTDPPVLPMPMEIEMRHSSLSASIWLTTRVLRWHRGMNEGDRAADIGQIEHQGAKAASRREQCGSPVLRERFPLSSCGIFILCLAFTGV